MFGPQIVAGEKKIPLAGFLHFFERETGFEPATPTLARSCSTTELFPRDCVSRVCAREGKFKGIFVKSKNFHRLQNQMFKKS